MINNRLSIVRFKLMLIGVYGQSSDDSYFDTSDGSLLDSVNKQNNSFHKAAVAMVLRLKQTLTQSSTNGCVVTYFVNSEVTYYRYYLNYLHWLEQGIDAILLGYEVYSIIQSCPQLFCEVSEDEKERERLSNEQTRKAILRDAYEVVMLPCHSVLDIVNRFNDLEVNDPLPLTLDVFNQPITSEEKVNFVRELEESDSNNVLHEMCDSMLNLYVLHP